MKKGWLFAISTVIGCGALIALSLPLSAKMKGAPVPFSADWANYEDGQRQEGGKYYASSEGIRLEGTAGGEPFVIIYNFNRMVAWNLIDSERMYIETSIDSDQSGVDDIGQFGAPCPPEARANRTDSETLNGRRTEKWTCVIPGEETMRVWYDTRLQTAIRSEDEEGRFELTNIQEGRQSASLFVPPPDYTRMEIPGFGMPRGSSYSDQQSGSTQEMKPDPSRGLQQKEAEDTIRGMPEVLRGLLGR